MAIYVTRKVDRAFSKSELQDDDLCLAATEVMAGRYEANLGGGVIKKRLPLKAGKSGGARTIIFFKTGKHLFFVDAWKKSSTSRAKREIEEDELATYKDLAKEFFRYDPTLLLRLISHKFLREVICNGGKSA